MLHIYTAKTQPATAWIDSSGEVEVRGGWKPKEMIYCERCMTRRPARDCVVQCFYDWLRIWCADGKGCQAPEVLAEKRRAAHMNRSRAQQARRAREASSNAKAQGGEPPCGEASPGATGSAAG